MANREEKKARARAERLERQKAVQAAEARRRLIGRALGGLLLVAAVAAVVVVIANLGGGSEETKPSSLGQAGRAVIIPAADPALVGDLPAAAEAANCEVLTNEDEGQDHSDGPYTYTANPATSGPHNIVPAEDGAYAEPPSTEQLLHSLEHGRVVIQFAPSAPQSARSKLQSLFDEDPYHLILTENATDMPYAVAATAWNQAIGCKRMSNPVLDAVRAFRETYRDQGPENVP